MAVLHLIWRRFVVFNAEKFMAFCKRTSLPGFHKIPIYDVIRFFFEEIKRDRITMRAAGISFNFLLAIFPSIIFVFTLIAYIPIEKLNFNLMVLLSKILPESGFVFLAPTIDDIISIERGGLLSFGFLLAFYFSTNGVIGMMRAFNKAHDSYMRRNYWKTRLAAFRLTFYLFALFLISVILIIAGDQIMERLVEKLNFQSSLETFFIYAFQWIMLIVLNFTFISLIYYYGPAKKERWRFITPGGTLAAVLSILASLGFGVFVKNFGMYNEVYGSIGTLIVLMIWININSVVLLVGFELNYSIDMNRLLRKKLTEGDY